MCDPTDGRAPSFAVRAPSFAEENLQMKKPTSKQTKLLQAKIFPWNGTTEHIKQCSHGKSLAGKEVR